MGLMVKFETLCELLTIQHSSRQIFVFLLVIHSCVSEKIHLKCPPLVCNLIFRRENHDAFDVNGKINYFTHLLAPLLITQSLVWIDLFPLYTPSSDIRVHSNYSHQ